MAENFNIQVLTTAAYSPWSNGVAERHNQTLTSTLLKIRADNNIDWETGLSWALMAKNSMHNEQGFSPHQLVFGKSPNLPSVVSDMPPALEGTSMSSVVGKHITALHTARKAYAESECSEKIRRALRKKAPSSTEKFCTGDMVYYKRIDSPEWKGPGVVIGQDGAVTFVRHGGTCIRVHHSRLQKITRQAEIEEDLELKGFQSEQGSVSVDKNSKNILEDNYETSDDDYGPEAGSDKYALHQQQTLLSKIKIGQEVKFMQNGISHTAQILSRAGKVTGKYVHWYNVQFSEPGDKAGKQGSVNLSKVDILEVRNVESLSGSSHDNVFNIEDVSFDKAKLEELESWKRNEVYVEVKDEGQRCVSTKWICTLKENAEGIQPKACLVARGFEELDKDLPKDSPTCSSESLRLIIAMFAQNKWQPFSMDIKTAFLQGSLLSRELYVRPPLEANAGGTVWKLKKCVYGLADASLYWYTRVKQVMKECGGQMSTVDPAVFFWPDNIGGVKGVLACHVDDFILGGNSDFMQTVVPAIRSELCVGREQSSSFRYLGMELLQFRPGELYLHQEEYAKTIHPMILTWARRQQTDSPLSEEETNIYRSKVGQILWLARQSRPDLMFDSSTLAAGVKNATVQNVVELNKVIRKMQAERVVLKFQHLGNTELQQLVVFSDSSLGNLSDGATQGGHLIVLMGAERKIFTHSLAVKTNKACCKEHLGC
ncbi:uncharacterized protein LOC135480371 [Liolophura sinensis]|uniref:uncharacterized protein LOC135480371 n=1 Tax=Liolophura sinensis TaxID=3198878 RepID=UPI003158D0F7